MLLTIAANRITSSGTRMFGDRHGLGSTEWKVLATLAANQGATGALISHRIGLDPAAVSRVLKTLSQRGIIRADPSDRHGKYRSLSLTDAGRRLHDEALQTACEREAMLLEGFSPEERATLVQMLRRLLDSRLLAKE